MRRETGSNDYVIQVYADPADIDATQWNDLLEAQPSATPFMRLEYLRALHDSGSATAETGWTPQFLGLVEAGRLVAACPLYLKTHSYGEYVFDWAWADAYQRHGLHYYPKLLAAVPFTPVPGARLLARTPQHRRVLLAAMQQLARDAGHSSAHLLFMDDADQAAARQSGWLMRSTVQFHWHNREPEAYRDFADFLAGLQRDKRKKIQQERRRVADAGVSFTELQGEAIDGAAWDHFYRCYRHTYRAHHSTPYLTRDFFARMADVMPDHWLLIVAMRAGQRIAASLIALDPERRTAYGRYWGALEAVDCLHFDACYYRPLAWCIAHGYRRFEGGAQGEHKMARGLMPVPTSSAHWLAHPQFAAAIGEYLQSEGEGMARYLDELEAHAPYKHG